MVIQDLHQLLILNLINRIIFVSVGFYSPETTLSEMRLILQRKFVFAVEVLTQFWVTLLIRRSCFSWMSVMI